jgi:benzoate-CoA ligase family protein
MIKGEQIDVQLPEYINLGSYYLDVNLALGRADMAALHYKGQVYSFLDLWRLTNRVGNVLKAVGVEPENRVLLILEDTPEWAAAWLATMKLGAVGTHAYTYLHTKDYRHLLELVRPKVVVVGSNALERVREARRGLAYPKALLVSGEAVGGLQEGEFVLREMIESSDAELSVVRTHRDDIAFWNFSGGTTGQPKGVPHTHRDGVLAYETFNHILGYGPDDIVLRVPKLFFHYARDLGFLFPLRAGASIVLCDEKSTAPRIFELVAQYRPSVLINVPTMMRAMIQTPAEQRADLHCVRRCMSSGELLSAELNAEWVETFGSEVVNRFGSAESGMGYLCNRPGAVRPGSSGSVTPLAEVKIIANDGTEVEKGTTGLLLVHCDAAAQYYVRNHEKSKATFLGDGWINTGDLFFQDDDDYFWYVGRANDMVKVSGVWIAPPDIEKALATHDEVLECAVLSVAGRDGLTLIKAFVVLRHGITPTSGRAEGLRRFCQELQGPHKAPRLIEFMDELPKTGQGKIDRRLLREQGADSQTVSQDRKD